MTVIPFRQRHTGGESAPVLALIRKAAIRGTFRAPSGRTGRMTGWLRLRRFVLVSDQLCAAGIFTGTLFDADGTPIGLGSRRHTAPAAVSNGGPEVTAVIGPVDVNLLGLTVTIEAFELALGEEMRPWSGGSRTHSGSPPQDREPRHTTDSKLVRVGNDGAGDSQPPPCLPVGARDATAGKMDHGAHQTHQRAPRNARRDATPAAAPQVSVQELTVVVGPEE